MIISLGQRTDIPAFYSKWLINRIKEGYVMVRNPYFPHNVTKFVLDPKIVDVLSFVTKNPRPMLKYFDYLKQFGMMWQITITGFGLDMEPNVPKIDDVIEDFKYISNQIGKNAVIWRYTPIIINSKYTVKYHLETFEYIAKRLIGYTDTVVFGFVDLYDKLKKNHPEIKDTDDFTKIYLAKEFKRIAKENDLEIRLCSSEKWLDKYGIDTSGCTRFEDYEKAIGKKLEMKKKLEARRDYCSCFIGNDIGVYNSCMHLCKYCYANSDPILVKDSFNKHSDDSPFLVGWGEDDDIISCPNQESWIDDVPTLFDFEF